MTPAKALLHPHRKEFKSVRKLIESVEAKDEPLELNLYITGYDEDETAAHERAGRRDRGPRPGGRRRSSEKDPPQR